MGKNGPAYCAFGLDSALTSTAPVDIGCTTR